VTLAARLLALAALVGCSNFTDAEGGIVAIEVTAPFPATIDVDESVQLAARALNKNGDAVAAEITWATPDATVTVDTATGVVTGVAVGTGRVQAVSGSVFSALVTITVEAPESASEVLRRTR
jgi:Bacterial Ig-like domain (group 2)